MEKNPPAVQDTWVRSLDWEDPLEEGRAKPLQYSCLENPMDGGAWWGAVHEVAKSRTRISDHAQRSPPHPALSPNQAALGGLSLYTPWYNHLPFPGGRPYVQVRKLRGLQGRRLLTADAWQRQDSARPARGLPEFCPQSLLCPLPWRWVGLSDEKHGY